MIEMAGSTAKSEIQEIITRYLLGGSTPAEDRLIEDKYASDPDFLELVNSVEDELIDDYVRHRLSRQQHSRFEEFFLLSPENRDKLEFARLLKKQIEQRARFGITHAPLGKPPFTHRAGFFFRSILSQGSGPSSALRLALTAIVLTVIVGGIWLLRRAGHLPQGSDQQTAVPRHEAELKQGTSKDSQGTTSENTGSVNNSTLLNQVSKRDSKHSPPPPKPPAVASFILTPGLIRSTGDANRIEVPKNAKWVELKLSIDSTAPYTAYRVSLKRVGGPDIWTYRPRNGRSKAPWFIGLKIPVKLLSTGEYLLTITGTTMSGESDVAGDYPFIVQKEK